MSDPAPPSAPVAATRGYCVDGCPNGGEPVPREALGDDDRTTAVVASLGVVIAALEAALLLALL